ncbi:MAG: DUF2806 domain-containing protein, partial [Halobacteriovoraceae bacterium]|nr:DUF2806 domain-containing protein [Halobacteriovoraceae bacterium]
MMSLIDLGNLSQPATVLIEKISEGIGGGLRPWQIKRVAEAEAEAKAKARIIEVKNKHEISKIEQQNLIDRMIKREEEKQKNIEQITVKALPHISDNANPNEMGKDWIANFIDKSEKVSDEEMQSLWAKVLAGEANKT